MATTNPLQAALQAAVDDGAFPGAVLAVRLRGTLIYEGAVGRLSPQIPGEGVTIHTCYDLASLTKVLATTTALLLLMQRGKLTLDDRIDRILIALQGSAAGAASIHQLLTHSSGLPGWRPYYERLASLEAGQAGFPGRTAAREAVLGYIAQEALVYERGSRSLYSDLGFMLLGWAVERLAGESLDQFCNNQIYRPLEAQPLAYVPRESQAMPAASLESHAIAPTEDDPWRGRMLCGEVHDENAFALGGVAGHAGLFGTALDAQRLGVDAAALQVGHGQRVIGLGVLQVQQADGGGGAGHGGRVSQTRQAPKADPALTGIGPRRSSCFPGAS